MRTSVDDLWKDIKAEAWFVLIIYILLSWFVMVVDVQRVYETKDEILKEWEYNLKEED